MQPESGDGNIEWRERAQYANPVGGQPDFFVCFPKGRLLECLARFDDAAGERHLPAVAPERVRSKRQQDVCGAVNGKDQQQSRGVTNSRRVESGRPLSTWPRGYPSVGVPAGKRPLG